MKRILPCLMCIMVAFALVDCKKSSTNRPNNAYCTTCSDTLISHIPDADSVFYYLPTAFTPNGDGINDVVNLYYNNLVADSSSLTVWDLSGNEVFSDNIKGRWEGIEKNGAKCAAGSYPVRLKLRTIKGATVDVCACVTLLTYSGSCIKTNGKTFYFPDQINISSGFTFATNDKLCP